MTPLSERYPKANRGTRARHQEVGMWITMMRPVYGISILAWYCHWRMSGLQKSGQIVMVLQVGMVKKRYECRRPPTPLLLNMHRDNGRTWYGVGVYPDLAYFYKAVYLSELTILSYLEHKDQNRMLRRCLFVGSAWLMRN